MPPPQLQVEHILVVQNETRLKSLSLEIKNNILDVELEVPHTKQSEKQRRNILNPLLPKTEDSKIEKVSER